MEDLEAFRRACERAGYPIIRRETEARIRAILEKLQPPRILEIGTCVGYSGCVMLSSCRGFLTTVEIDEQKYLAAGENFRKYGDPGRVFRILGDCREVVPLLDRNFEAIFLDGPKGQYPNLLPYLSDLLVPGGVLLADNTEFHGMVSGTGPVERRERTHRANLRKFAEMLRADPQFQTVFYTDGDGMTVSYKR